MAVPAPEHLNRQFWEVLRDGPDSPSARWFDIDWAAQAATPDGRGRVLLPILGERLGEELERGSLTVDPVGGPEGEPALRYFGHVLPIRPGTEGLPLPELIDRQWYRLGWWRLAASELNYRRFFSISELIAVRVEDPEVFAAVHAVPLRLLREGVLDGLRFDHPDGLADPAGYLRRLDAATGGGCWTVVEKILTGEERLPEDWACAGTTGYDSMRRIDGLFTAPDGPSGLEEVYREFLAARVEADGGDWTDGVGGQGWEEVVDGARREVVGTPGELGSEVERLVRLVGRIGAADQPALRDHPSWAVREAVAEMLAAYPVYRPYGGSAPGEGAELRDAEAAHEAAFEMLACTDVTEPHAATADLVRDLLLGRAGRSPQLDEFRARFGQTAAAVAAKGVEDTAFYRWYPLLSRNEVGAGPGLPASSPEEFAAHCEHLQRRWPTGSTALSTHDTKRSADVRARLAVLAEIPEVWAAVIAELSALGRRHRDGEDGWLLDGNVEYLVWQTLVGAWPVSGERLREAVLKSVREAGVRTSWTERHEQYERVVVRFVEGVAGDGAIAARIEGLLGEWVRPAERCNSLGMQLVQLAMPGVPDVYQGGEGVGLSLVDPDNRRAVDHGGLGRRLDAVDAGAAAGAAVGVGAVRDLTDETILVTAAALRLRRERPEWFGPGAAGECVRLEGRGSVAEHVFALRRGPTDSGSAVVAAVTRLPVSLERSGGWGGTVLPLPGAGGWVDALTGRRFSEEVRVRELFERFPVALLVRA
jgi:(1->4)-alpha-D-glucan 1-alpha-D-glucosylmutase